MDRRHTVLVTGASKGLGLAVVNILLSEFNANVVVFSRTITPELAALGSAHPSTLLCCTGDVTDPDAVSRTIAQSIATFSHIDGLILNAAVLEPLGQIATEHVPLDAWKTHFDVNFFSLITFIRGALPGLRASELGGRIVFVSSGSAVKGTSTMGPYNASKAAMNSLCRTLAEEEPAVTSVAMRPGTVDTQMQTQLRASSSLSEKTHKMFIGLQTDGKLIQPEESGYVIAALAVKAPKSLSGQFVSWDAEECKEFRR